MPMKHIAMTPASVLLLGLRAAMTQRPESHMFSRDTWLLKVLVEQMLETLPNESTCRVAAQRLRDPRRGVTDARVARATEHLRAIGFLEAHGTGRDAVWSLPQGGRSEVTHLWSSVSTAEQLALNAAAQRTLATSEAWSKTVRV